MAVYVKRELCAVTKEQTACVEHTLASTNACARRVIMAVGSLVIAYVSCITETHTRELENMIDGGKKS